MQLPRNARPDSRRLRFFPDDNGFSDPARARILAGPPLRIATVARGGVPVRITGVVSDGSAAYRVSFRRGEALQVRSGVRPLPLPLPASAHTKERVASARNAPQVTAGASSAPQRTAGAREAGAGPAGVHRFRSGADRRWAPQIVEAAELTLHQRDLN